MAHSQGEQDLWISGTPFVCRLERLDRLSEVLLSRLEVPEIHIGHLASNPFGHGLLQQCYRFLEFVLQAGNDRKRIVEILSRIIQLESALKEVARFVQALLGGSLDVRDLLAPAGISGPTTGMFGAPL